MKVLKLFAVALLATSFLAACSKEDNNTPNNTLTHQGKTTSYQLWVGSPQGGKQVDTKGKLFADILPARYKETLVEESIDYSSYTIEFVNDKSIILNGENGAKTYPYYFKNDSLYLTFEYEGKPDNELFGVGNTNQVKMYEGKGYCTYNRETSSSRMLFSLAEFQEPAEKGLERALKAIGCKSLAEMTVATDTIAIYSVIESFGK